MTFTGSDIAQLLHGSWRATVEPAPAYFLEKTDLIKTVRSTGGTGLILRRLAHLDAPLVDELRADHKTSQLMYHIQLAAIAAFSDQLHGAGIDHLYFKGWTTARHYHDPACRPLGDIDFLVHPDNHDKTFAVMQSLSHNPDIPLRSGTVVLKWKFPEHLSKVDFHDDISKFDLPNAAALLNSIEMHSPDTPPLPALRSEELLRLICIHAMRHECWRPIWLVDIAAFIEQLQDTFDWDAVHLNDPRLMNWLATCFGLAHDLLGMKIDNVPQNLRSGKSPNWLTREVLHNWTRSFSDYHNRTNLSYTLRKKPWRILQEVLKRWPSQMQAVISQKEFFNTRQNPTLKLRHAITRLTS